jgi:predicted lipoprotein with Yx(FWY)xxD motif
MPLLLLLATAVAAPTINVHASKYGPIAFDGRGFALYAFTADKPSRSTCYGACAAAWPPYIVKRKPTGNRLLGVTLRRDGRLQVTLAGRPLYYYVGDRRAGQILCQNVPEFGGIWRVVRENGTLVR